MSFNETFDFSMTVQFLQKQLAVYQSQLATIDQEILQFKQVKGFSNIAETQLKSLEQRKKSLSPRAEEIQKTLANISALSALKQADKDALKALHTLSGEDDSTYMARLVSSHKEILTDKDVQALLKDTANTKDVKALLARHILAKYSACSGALTIMPGCHAMKLGADATKPELAKLNVAKITKEQMLCRQAQQCDI